MDVQFAQSLGRWASRARDRAKYHFKLFAIASDGTYKEIPTDGVLIETSEGRGVFLPLAGAGGPHDIELLACPLHTTESDDSAHFVTKHGCSNAYSVTTVLTSETQSH